MAKMGFYPHTTPFRPSPFCPPCFHLSRSRCHSVTKQFSRIEDAAPSYSPARHNHAHASKNSYPDGPGLDHVNPKWFKEPPGHTRQGWREITDECRQKRLHLQANKTSTSLLQNRIPESSNTSVRNPYEANNTSTRPLENRITESSSSGVRNPCVANNTSTRPLENRITESSSSDVRNPREANNTSTRLLENRIPESSSPGVRNPCQANNTSTRLLENRIPESSNSGVRNLCEEGNGVSGTGTIEQVKLKKKSSHTNNGDKKSVLRRGSNGVHPNGTHSKGHNGSATNNVSQCGEREIDSHQKESDLSNNAVQTHIEKFIVASESIPLRKRLLTVYDKVLVVDCIPAAQKVVNMLTQQYKDLIHACDTEVSNINVKAETPVGHGEIICFSIYSGPEADFGDGKSCIWVDVLDGGGSDILSEFAPFFEDSSIKKVWHNYSFDNHVIENYGIKLSGFFADTMHMARLFNSDRKTSGGYSLEALTKDRKIMSGAKKGPDEELIGKVSMKNIFGKKKLKRDGSEGKLTTIPPVEELQKDERDLWICYSALDSISTLMLYESLEMQLSRNPWNLEGQCKGSMFDFYQQYIRPFGEILVEMETEGVLVNRPYLADIEKVAKAEQQDAANKFREWASQYSPDAMHMNLGSDTQLRQLFFGGIQNRNDPNEFLPMEKEFLIPNVDNIIEEGKKVPLKNRKIKLRKPDFVHIEADKFTDSGWPSVSGDVLKSLAGKVSADIDIPGDENVDGLSENDNDEDTKDASSKREPDTSSYGKAYSAFGGGQAGIEACHAIAALCLVCSIDSLISNFIIPLQGNNISGKNGRIHCSLNINTETGRLSARRPNLQNQPALEKDRYKIRRAFIAAPGNSLIVADYGQLELRILAHLANCKSMLHAFKAGGDFHSRTAMNMYPHIYEAIKRNEALLEWHPQPGQEKPPVPLLKDLFASERRKAKMLNFSIAYGKTTVGLARDWGVSREEAQQTVDRWYSDRQEVLSWQEERKKEARTLSHVHTLLGRQRHFPNVKGVTYAIRNHIERAAINTPVQGSAADVAMCAMLEISKNIRLKELGWKLLLQVHDEVILEGPTESAEEAKAIVVHCMENPFDGVNFLRVGLSVDAKFALDWYSAK